MSCSSDVTCANGCCASAPCLNGGTCNELCEDAKHKLNCTCVSGYTGKTCEKKARSCKDYLVNNSPHVESGKYTLFDTKEQTYQVFCDFALEDNRLVWTVIESFAMSNKNEFRDKAFFKNHPLNEKSFNWDEFRLSLDQMKELAGRSTEFRATCNYNTEGFNMTDYIRAKLTEISILSYSAYDAICKKYEYINIRGISCMNCTGSFAQKDSWHAHVNSIFKYGCDIDQVKGVTTTNFGSYSSINPTHRCTAGQDSTTQWWLGEPFKTT